MNFGYLTYRCLTRFERLAMQFGPRRVMKSYPRGRNAWFDLLRMMNYSASSLTIFDVGANEGQTVSDIQCFFPNATIHCFEPVESAFRKLTDRQSSRSGAHLHPVACGDAPQTLTIALTDVTVCNSLRYVVDPLDTTKSRTQEVQVVRIDDFCASNQITGIDILKTDTEGFDLQVLLGCGELLDKISFVLTEVGFHGQPDQTAFSEISLLLSQNGLKFAGLYEVARGPSLDFGVPFANALFARVAVN